MTNGSSDSMKTAPEATVPSPPRVSLSGLHQLIDLLVERAANDRVIRALLYETARSLMAMIEAMPGETTSTSFAEGSHSRSPMMHSYRPGMGVPVSLLKPVPVGGSMLPPAFRDVHSPGMSGWQSQAPSDDDLPTIEARCRLKSEASRWAGLRQRLLKDGVDFHAEVEPRDRDVIGRAKALPECFLRMNHKDTPIPRDLSIFDDLAGAYETTAYALSLLRAMLKVAREDREAFGEILQLTAEAQSCVRGAVLHLDGKPDRDQMKIFYWLRAAGAEYQILIRRFMRQDDIADFRTWPEVRHRLEELEGRLSHLKNRDKNQKLLLTKIRHLARKVEEKPKGSDDDWLDLLRSVDEVIDLGIPPSHKELREVLLPVVDWIPDLPEMSEFPKNVGLVLRDIDHYRTMAGVNEELEDDDYVSDEVRKTAKWLGGKAVVLIGGDRRPSAEKALIESFDLSELIWIETREHQTHTSFEPYVARDDVAVVILAIRWSSHGFGEVKEFCDRHNKPLVRLPAGYGPNQVAYHIVHQIGDRLSGK